MAFHYYPSYCKKHKSYRYKYFKVMAEDDHVDFSYQFVKDSRVTSHALSNNKGHNLTKSLNRTSKYIMGTPTHFPNYGDFPETLVMRTGGFDISTSPYQREEHYIHHYDHSSPSLTKFFGPQYMKTIRNNYIDLEFHEAVYPIRVSIYEIYNPGYVTEIWAELNVLDWVLLWGGESQNVSPTSRIFSPPLETYNFKTNKIRLKFKSSVWDYYTRLDAVMLIGTSKLILPKDEFHKRCLTNLLMSINCKYPCHEDIHNLTPDYKSVHSDISDLRDKFSEYCIIFKSDNVIYTDIKNYCIGECKKMFQRENVQHFENKCIDLYSKYTEMYLSEDTVHDTSITFIKDIKSFSSYKSKEQSSGSFSLLPDELILKIFKKLDMKSLCRINRVNKHLNNLARDPLLFTCLNLQNITNCTNSICIRNIMLYFASRCKYVKQLDLASSDIPPLLLIHFLKNCGSQLTHLRLNSYDSYRYSSINLYTRNFNGIILLIITRKCKNLKVLDLGNGYWYLKRNKKFSYLENLEFLEELDLSGTNIREKTLCKILQKNRRIRNLYLKDLRSLSMWRPQRLLHLDVIQLNNSCPNLEVIDLSFNTITPQGIDVLAECKNLLKLNMRNMTILDNNYTLSIDKRSLRRIFSSCQRLEEINLIGCIDDLDEEFILCKNLRKLHLNRICGNTIFEQCSKLQEIHVIYNRFFSESNCYNRERYPHVLIYEEEY